MENERRTFKAIYPDQYPHVWLGQYKTVHKGAYFLKELIDVQQEGRIRKIRPERHKALWTFHDIGGSGHESDAYCWWTTQFGAQDVRMLDYYETQGQSPEYHHEYLLSWCMRHKFKHCIIFLPWDGDSDKLNRTWRKVWKGFSEKEFLTYHVMTAPKTLRGAAMARITASRQMLPHTYFDQRGTQTRHTSDASVPPEDRPNTKHAIRTGTRLGIACM